MAPSLPLSTPPRSLCILRLSAVGDICHTLPVVRTLQQHWPETHLTWIIGRLEHTLVGDIPGIDFIIFDKGRRWAAYRDLARALRGRRFDALLHMQMSLRASLASTLVRAPIRLGFDRARAKDGQWLFSNTRIAPRHRQHVLDSLFGFSEALGVNDRTLRWDIPIPDSAREFAHQVLPADRPVLAISPCASKDYRNWSTHGYAEVADYARENYGATVVLTGGPSAIERRYADAISAATRHSPLDLVGKTNLKQLLAVLERADAILAPDSGPAHMGTAVGTPVIGLYAATNPERAGPYLSREHCVSHYHQAVVDKFGKPPEQLPWGVRVRDPGTMERIGIEEVEAKLGLLRAAAPTSP